MITFTKLGQYGRLGNQLHQIASLIGFSEKYQCKLLLPKWKYSDYFANTPLQHEDVILVDNVLEEKEWHFTPEYWDEHKELFKHNTVDIVGYLQSQKYWQHCKEKVFASLLINTKFEMTIKQKLKKVFEKQVIAICIRRGDYVTNPDFYLLPLTYYLGALLKHFNDYKDFNILFFSDDIQYCKIHIKKQPNFFFSTLNEIEDLCAMTLCNHHIIGNSTLSWWGAMLSKSTNVVIRPNYHFDGKLLKLDTKDYYPEQWNVYDHLLEPFNISSFLNGAFVQKLVIARHNIDRFIIKSKSRIKYRLSLAMGK